MHSADMQAPLFPTGKINLCSQSVPATVRFDFVQHSIFHVSTIHQKLQQIVHSYLDCHRTRHAFNVGWLVIGTLTSLADCICLQNIFTDRNKHRYAFSCSTLPRLKTAVGRNRQHKCVAATLITHKTPLISQPPHAYSKLCLSRQGRQRLL